MNQRRARVDDFDFSGASTAKAFPVEEVAPAAGTITALADRGPSGMITLSVDFPETTTEDLMTRQAAEALFESLKAVLS